MALRRQFARARKNNKYEAIKEDSCRVFGFHDCTRFIEESEKIEVLTRSIVLPISTRPIGLMISSMRNYFTEHLKGDCNRYLSALYRLSLLQLEVKLQVVMEIKSSRHVGARSSFTDIYVDPEMRSICIEVGALFRPLYDLISSVGLIVRDDQMFIPRMARRTVGDDGFDPCLIMFSNLREYVVMLSDPKSSKLQRSLFEKYDPLPCAKWNKKEQFETYPLLLNPDEIMPANYNCESLRQDIDLIMNAIQKLSIRFPRSVSDIPLDYRKEGAENILYSCELENKFEQEINIWVPEYCQNTCLKHGYCYLFGELPSSRAVTDYSVYAIRFSSRAKESERLTFSPSLAIARYFSAAVKFDEMFTCLPHGTKVRLPISTRGIGFIVESIADRFTAYIKEQNHMKFRLALYRITLMLVEKKLQLDAPCEVLSIDMYNNEFPIPLSNLISVLNPRFNYEGVEYEIFIPEGRNNDDFHKEYQYDPCLITFSNLLDYVQAMKSPGTPACVRKYFRKYNKIPGLKWDDDDPNAPLLLNADEIMHNKYYHDKLYALQDWHEISMAIKNFGMRPTDYGFDEPSEEFLKKYIFRGNFTKERSQTEEVFFPSFFMIKNQLDYMHGWSANTVQNVDAYLSMIYMFGEIPARPQSVENFLEVYGFRLLHCAKYEWETRRPPFAY